MNTQRHSQQRELIYQALCETKEHPTAQMIYDSLRPTLPKLSLGTVYRNLQQMVQSGRILELAGPVSHYDATVEPHTHLQCSCCGRIADASLSYDIALDGKAVEEGWSIETHRLMFIGICPACAGK